LGALKRKSRSIVCVGAIGTGSRITRQSLQKKKDSDLHSVRSPAARLGPNKISIARLPVTGSNFFGREADIALLDEAWANQRSSIVTIIAWAGAGKSTLVNQWLLRTAAEHYRSAEFVFGWSFYRQGTSGRASSADVRSTPKEKVDKQVGMIKRIPSSVRRQSGKDQRPLLLAKEQVRRSAVRARGCERLVRESGGYVALCPELDIASEGESIEQAMHNLKEAVEGFFEVASPAEIETRLKRPALFTHFEVRSRRTPGRASSAPRDGSWR
jgi:predicted RNase H-like HicB family nuclease